MRSFLLQRTPNILFTSMANIVQWIEKGDRNRENLPIWIYHSICLSGYQGSQTGKKSSSTRLGNSRGRYFAIIELYCYFVNSNLRHLVEFSLEFLNKGGVERVREEGVDALSMRKGRGLIEQRVTESRQGGRKTKGRSNRRVSGK